MPRKEKLSEVIKTCKRGHTFVSGTGGCKLCSAERSRLWSKENHDRAASNRDNWRKKNKEAFVAQQREYRQKNASRYNQHTKNWYERSRHKTGKHKCGDPWRNLWRGMIDRCCNPKATNFHRYGGRGITVTEVWLGEDGFERFKAYMGPRPSKKHTLDREDNNGNYEPGNVKWATPVEQARNKSTTRIIEYMGIKMCAKDWAARMMIPYSTLLRRIVTLGWSIEKAFTEPLNGKFLIHRAMCKRAMLWLSDVIACQIVTSEFAARGNGSVEMPDAFGWSNEGTYLVECKMSRGEFFADSRKKVRKDPKSGLGKLRYYLVPFGIIVSEEVPQNWGLLYAGETITKVKEAQPFGEWNEDGEKMLMMVTKRRMKNGSTKPTI